MAVPNIIKKVDEGIWEIPKTYKEGMNVPAQIFASKKVLDAMDDGVFEQITNVSCLPGIEKAAMCMPDGHWGYGFPIGGVAGFNTKEGVISPGGIGFDINCGMRMLVTNLTLKDVKPKLKELIDHLFKIVPTGVGCKGFVDIQRKQFDELVTLGSKWCIENGYGWKEDLERTENYGSLVDADVAKVSDKAVKRGIDQVGTLGSGNHYLEIQVVHKDNIFDPVIAKKFGIVEPEQIVVMFHCGSRGFGHQIATDYLKTFESAMKKYGIKVLDRELSCAPYNSKEGSDYFKAMSCAANMAFANRQVILHRVREGFSHVFGRSAEDLNMHLIYDCAHNICYKEKHKVNGKTQELLIHRKGATKSFGPGREEVPKLYQQTGSPVILGGSMETGSYLLVGTKKAEELSFASTAHGSGRTMSREKAKAGIRGEQLQKDMQAHGIYVRAASMSGLAEEAGSAYKSINEVVESLELSGISKKVVALKPIGNIKG